MLWRVLKKVFGEGKYVGYAALLSLIPLFLIVWLPNLKIIGLVLGSGIGAGEKLSFLLSLVSGFAFTYGPWHAFYLLGAVILFGLNGALIFYYLGRQGWGRRPGARQALASVGGLGTALLGVGCAACGALFLAPLIGTAAGGLLVFLPMRGFEFLLLGLVILAWTLYATTKKIDNPFG